MANYDIGVRVGSTSDDRGLKQTQSTIKELGKDAEHAEKRFSGLGDTFRKVAVAALAFVGVQKVFSFLKDSFAAAIEGEKALRQYDIAATQFGGTLATQLPTLHEWIDALEKASGVSKEELLPSFTTLVAVTRDTAVAQKLLETAAGAAARGIGDLSSNVHTMASVMQGRPLRGVDGFSAALREAYNRTGDWGMAIEELVGSFSDGGQAMDDLSTNLDRSKTAWDNTREAIGNMTYEAGERGPSLMKMGAYAVALLAAGITKLVGIVVGAATAYREFGRAMLAVARMDIPAAIEAADAAATVSNKVYKEYVDRAQKMLDDVVSAWDQHTTAINTRVRNLGRVVNQRIAEAKPDAAATTKKSVQDVEADRERELAALRKSILRDSLMEQEAYGNARINIANNVAASEKMATVDAVNMGLNALSAAFPKSKEIAAAQAIINTYTGATKALEQGGIYGAILAAVVIAAGMKMVQQIYATEPGGTGGSSGGSVSMGGASSSGATMGGGMSHYNPAAGSFATRQGSQTWSNSNHQVSYNVSALTGSDAAETMRQFERKRHAPARAYKRTIVTRGSTTIGRQ